VLKGLGYARALTQAKVGITRRSRLTREKMEPVSPLSLEHAQEMTRLMFNAGRAIFPLPFPVSRFPTQRIAAGLLARILGSAESAVTVSALARQADLAILVRSLYEHVVMLAWLTGDPDQCEERRSAWLAAGDRTTLLIDDENSTVLQRDPLLPDEVRKKLTELRSEARARGLTLPPTLERAETADQAGTAGFVGPGGDPSAVTLRGLYTTLYRPMSGVVHPTELGIYLVTYSGGRAGTRLIGMEPRREDAAAATLIAAAALLIPALAVCAAVLGRPNIDELKPAIDEVLRIYGGEDGSQLKRH
jgi:hypothetical protein